MRNIITKVSVGITTAATAISLTFLGTGAVVPVAHATTDVSATDVADSIVKAEHPNSNYGSDVYLESSGDVGHSDGDSNGSHTCVSTTSTFPDQCNHQALLVFHFPTITDTNTVSSLILKMRRTNNSGNTVCSWGYNSTSSTRWGSDESHMTFNNGHIIEWAHPANPNQGDIDTTSIPNNDRWTDCETGGYQAGQDESFNLTGAVSGLSANQLSGHYLYVTLDQFNGVSSGSGVFNHGDPNGNTDYNPEFASKERTSANTYCSDNNCAPKLDLAY